MGLVMQIHPGSCSWPFKDCLEAFQDQRIPHGFLKTKLPTGDSYAGSNRSGQRGESNDSSRTRSCDTKSRHFSADKQEQEEFILHTAPEQEQEEGTPSWSCSVLLPKAHARLLLISNQPRSPSSASLHLTFILLDCILDFLTIFCWLGGC